MKILIDIPKEQYNLISQLRGKFVRQRYVDMGAIMYTIENGRVLNETEVKKVDEIIKPIHKHGCCSCPHSGSIIDGYRDCPDAYTEQAQYCGFYGKGE